MTDRTPDAFLFDMDGLLLDTERVGSQAFVTVMATHGRDAGEADAFYRTLVGTSARDTHERLVGFLGTPDVDHVKAAWFQEFDRQLEAGIPVKETVYDALETLAAANHRMAVVTSTAGERARSHLADASLLDFFETVVGGDEVTANKPDPTPYLTAASRLGVKPERCAAFEDSDRGVRAAVSAGCRTVQIPDVRPLESAFPELGQVMATSLGAAIRHFLN